MEGYCNNGAIHGLYKRLPPQGWGDIRQLTFKGTTHLVKAKWVVAFITWTHIRETHIRELGKYYWGIRSSILEDSITLSSQLLVVKLFSTTANILQPPFLCKRIIQIYWASNKVSARTGVISSHNSKSHSHGSSKIAINLFTFSSKQRRAIYPTLSRYMGWESVQCSCSLKNLILELNFRTKEMTEFRVTQLYLKQFPKT